MRQGRRPGGPLRGPFQADQEPSGTAGSDASLAWSDARGLRPRSSVSRRIGELRAAGRAGAELLLVRAVFPDAVIPAPQPDVPSDSQLFSLFHPTHSHSSPTPTEGGNICGTASSPEQDPEALSVINADGAAALGIDGTGITVGYIAGRSIHHSRLPAQREVRLLGLAGRLTGRLPGQLRGRGLGRRVRPRIVPRRQLDRVAGQRDVRPPPVRQLRPPPTGHLRYHDHRRGPGSEHHGSRRLPEHARRHDVDLHPGDRLRRDPRREGPQRVLRSQPFPDSTLDASRSPTTTRSPQASPSSSAPATLESPARSGRRPAIRS